MDENDLLKYSDITGYLPYCLECVLIEEAIENYTFPKFTTYKNSDFLYENLEVSKINFTYEIISLQHWGKCWSDDFDIHEIKPILNSMDDITKPVTHPEFNGGKPFNLFLYLVNKENIPNINYDTVEYIHFTEDKEIYFQYKDIFDNYVSYFIILDIDKIEILNKFHFDYNNLIGRNLAIKNNYENKKEK